MPAKKIWLTDHSNHNVFTMTFESESLIAHEKMRCDEFLFPDRNDASKTRHTLCVGMLSFDNLVLLRDKLNDIIDEH